MSCQCGSWPSSTAMVTVLLSSSPAEAVPPHAVSAASARTAGMAVSSVEGGLRPLNFYACNFAGQIAYHDFEGVTVRSEEGERLVRNLGDKRIKLVGIDAFSLLLGQSPAIQARLWA